MHVADSSGTLSIGGLSIGAMDTSYFFSVLKAPGERAHARVPRHVRSDRQGRVPATGASRRWLRNTAVRNTRSSANGK